jgi:hypothetical protein
VDLRLLPSGQLLVVDSNSSPPAHSIDGLAPKTVPARAAHGEAFWLAAHTLVNFALFTLIGGAALLIDWLAHWCIAAGANTYLCIMLGGAALLLAAVDLVAFVRLEFFLFRAYFRRRARQ